MAGECFALNRTYLQGAGIVAAGGNEIQLSLQQYLKILPGPAKVIPPSCHRLFITVLLLTCPSAVPGKARHRPITLVASFPTLSPEPGQPRTSSQTPVTSSLQDPSLRPPAYITLPFSDSIVLHHRNSNISGDAFDTCASTLFNFHFFLNLGISPSIGLISNSSAVDGSKEKGSGSVAFSSPAANIPDQFHAAST